MKNMLKILLMLLMFSFLAASKAHGQSETIVQLKDTTIAGVKCFIPVKKYSGYLLPGNRVKGAMVMSATVGKNLRRISTDTLSNSIEAASFALDSSLHITGYKSLIGRSLSAVTIDSIYYLCIGGSSPSLVPKISYGSDISQTGTATVTNPAAVTSNTVGTTVVNLNNASVPINNNIWFEFTTVTTKPYQFAVTLYYH
jgi:hypothetical protein